MTRNQRLGLVVLAVAVAVAAFLIARPNDDEQESAGTGGEPAQTETATTGERTAKEPAPEPRLEQIEIRAGVPRGGVASFRVKKGGIVRLVVTSDAPDEIHVHGYDIRRRSAPGKPARFRFKADIEGVFEIESHVAEDAGKEPRVARLVVEPS